MADPISIAMAAFEAGDPEAAIGLLRAAIRSDPTAPLYHYHLGYLYWAQNRGVDAAACFEEARRLDPSLAEAPLATGIECARAGMLAEAEDHLRLALAFRPDHPVALSCRGDVLRRLGRTQEALPLARAAVRLAPEWPDAHLNLGIALSDADRFEEAASALQTALRLNPSDVRMANNLGMVYKQQGRIDDALRWLDRAVELAPDFAAAHLNRAMTLLLAGDFERGWREYEWRPKTALPLERPLEPGVPLDGKTVLLHQEQGLGDLIQFVRYAEPLASMGAKVIVEADERAAPLIRTARGVSAVAPCGSPLPEFDRNARLLSLPRILHPSLAAPPVEVPYLFADPGKVSAWRERLGSQTRVRVGLVWGGSSGNAYDRRRSIPLSELAPVVCDAGVAAYALQRGPRAAELRQLDRRLGVVDLEADSGSIMDTAAAMMCLDLVISADTMPAHLAAALGKPVWLLLPFVPDWRWMLKRADSPWYPTMRLFRQSRPGSWQEVVRQVGEALRGLDRDYLLEG